MDLKIKLPCPKCKHSFDQDVRRLRPGAVVACPHCGASIKFSGDDASSIAKSIDRSVDQLNAAFKRTGS